MPTPTYANHSPAFGRRLITHHRKSAMISVAKAKSLRAYRAALAVDNPSAVQFYPERLDLLVQKLAYHRRLISEGYASLRAAAVLAHRVAA